MIIVVIRIARRGWFTLALSVIVITIASIFLALPTFPTATTPRMTGGEDRGVLLVRRIEVTREQLVHSKHVYPLLLEDGTHAVIAADLALVVWILEFV